MRSLLARLLRRLSRALGVTEIQDRLDQSDSRVLAIEEFARGLEQISRDAFTVAQFSEKRASEYTDVRIAELERNLHGQIVSSMRDVHGRIESLTKQGQDIVFHSDQRKIQIDQAVEEIEVRMAGHRDSSDRELADLRRRIDILSRSIENSPLVGSTRSDQAHTTSNSLAHQNPISDALYVALEDHFRGDPAVIESRQSVYVDIVSGCVNREHPLLDVGCGRGEWLRSLARSGIAARGIDSNVASVAECRESGLNVEHADLVEFLRGSADASFGALTFFQVMEHLPFPVLVEVFRECRRVLTSGGVLIAEIPNTKNLRVGAGTFWIDPTHQNPLFPDLLLFLARESGFRACEEKYLNPLMPPPDLSDIPQSLRPRLEAIFDAIDGPADFALIARA